MIYYTSRWSSWGIWVIHSTDSLKTKEIEINQGTIISESFESLTQQLIQQVTIVFMSESCELPLLKINHGFTRDKTHTHTKHGYYSGNQKLTMVLLR